MLIDKNKSLLMLELENSILIILRPIGDINPPGNLYELTIFHHSI